MLVSHAHWHPYTVQPGHNTVHGNLQVTLNFHSPQLGNQRTVLVYLPPSYHDSGVRYPVLYMQDGQNLFDATTAFGGVEWQVDETMEQLAAEGLEAIVVGLHHAGNDRLAEYNPFPFGRWVGRGEQYLDFLVHTVKPMIDSTFNTEPGRQTTGILGSSMGGLISLYAFFRYPHIFGLAGVMSPSLWLAQSAIYDYVRSQPYSDGKIYLDHGTREASAKPMRDLLREKGYRLRHNLKYVAEKGARHTEWAWAKRLPEALRFLLKS
ncbi:MAG: alpha/beta hydrolase [Anaerolineales bacterium]